jgi:hypothetical protein
MSILLGRRLCRRALGGIVIGIVIVLGGTPAGLATGLQAGKTLGMTQAPAAAPMGWLQLPPDCPLASAVLVPGDGEQPQVVACGGLGSFVFGKPGLHDDAPCGDLRQGSGMPSPIPVEPAPRLPAAFPCAGGNCLGRSAGRPWVAILDWPSEHGWSVAATIREAADQQVDVQLYDLTLGGSLDRWASTVSDLHVLAHLCAVAEAAQQSPGDRPLAVSMSFGRRDTGPCGTSDSGLGCAVGRVLSYLTEQEGIPTVAAAGNDGEMLFPASSPDVVSAGALDLSHFQVRREARASTQTPVQAGALMLGYGLHLSMGDGNPGWPAPPGSSYAAALFTGWLSGTLAGGGQLPPPAALRGARWAPIPTPGGFALALNGTPLTGSGLQGPRRLLDRALGAVPTLPEGSSDATLWLTGPAPPLSPLRSLLYADAGNGPLPGVDPCVPCEGGGRRAAEGAETVVIDLSSSGSLPDGMELLAVWLRVGKQVYGFDRSRDPDLLASVATGKLDRLVLSGVDGIFPADEQPSLVLVVSVGGPDYWHEIPIQLHP